MEKVTTTIICDMCGAEIDTSDDSIIVKSAISSGFYGVLVHEHNPSYDKGFRTHITQQKIDLCPACADRATRIHCEVVPTDGGRSCRHELSWRDETKSEVVHCKDCKHFTPNDEIWAHPPAVPFPIIGATSDSCDFWAGTKVKVEPDGFCKWGER